MRKVIFFILISICANSYADQCIKLPLGEVSGFSQETVKLCHKAYVSYFDVKNNITTNVSYILTPSNGLTCSIRSQSFKKDPLINNSPIPSDYEDSDFDRGHLSPYLDNAWEEDVAQESFYMTNVAPQYPGLNRGVWKTLENNIRIWSYTRNHDLLIYVGSIKRELDKKIGITKVDVPAMFYKIVVDLQTKENLAFIFPNEQKVKQQIYFYQVSVHTIENRSGLSFPVLGSKDIKYGIWEIDNSKYSEQKRQKCKKEKR